MDSSDMFATDQYVIYALIDPTDGLVRYVGQTSQPKQRLAGLRFSVQNRMILTLLITVSLVMLGASAFNSLDIFFVLGNLHAPVKLYGVLATAQGVGLILGAVVAGAFAQRLGLIRTFTSSLLLCSIALLGYARMTSFAPALILVAIAGVFQAALNVPAGPLLLRVTPRAYIGRVAATINPTSAIMQVLGTMLAGYLASNVLLHLHVQALGMTFGPIDTIFTGGALLALLGGGYALLRLGLSDPPTVVEEAPAVSEEIAASAEPLAASTSLSV